VVKDDGEGVKWFRKAAEQGYAPAQTSLGVYYYQGKGGVNSIADAYKWFLLALAQGDEAAKKNMPNIERKLSSAQRSEGQRLAQEWTSKRANNDVAQ
jgi:TPR repeat protein